MMRHKYLPRLWQIVLGLGGAVGVGAACTDSTGPAARGPQLLLTLEAPPSDSLGQLGVAISAARSDSAPLKEVRVYVDSAAGVQPTYASTYCCSGRGTFFRSVVTLPGPGHHTMTVVGVDTVGQSVSASAAWTVRVSDEGYTATVLPDSGAGGGTRFVHANGTVAGWIGGRNGRRRPALWRDGVLTVLGATDSLDGTATRVNAAGDVLLEYSRDTMPYRDVTAKTAQSVRVRRADGATFILGPNRYVRNYATYGFPNIRPDTLTTCCRQAGDLTESRLALGASPAYVEPGFGEEGYGSAVLDVTRGTRADSMAGTFVGLNNAGQAVGSITTRSLYPPTTFLTRGFTAAYLPSTIPASVCDPVGRYATLVPVDFDESANVLASWCGNPVWLPPAGGTSRWLDRAVGRSKAIHLSRTGQIIASLDSVGSIYLWRAATNRTTRVQVAGDTWRIDSLAAVNTRGQIAAHGVERTTGRGAALLLTPAP